MVRGHIFLGLFALVVALFVNDVHSRTEPSDLAALIAFRDSFTTFQPTWPLESVDPCDNLPLYYFTITCLPPTQPYFPWRVGKINLDCYGLRGTVPSLTNFTTLRYIDLGNNYLSGTIADSLFPPRLMYINLFNNTLEGTVPSFSNVTQLLELYLAKNSFTGTIPTTYGTNYTLRVLSLNSNNLTGTIPSLLSNYSNLSELFLANNSLSGTIPSQLGNLSKLLILSLWKSGLNGTIPSQLANMKALRFLYLDRNELTGTIPVQLGNFTDLRILYLRENKLTGAIPSQLGNLNSLSALSLAINNFTGPIPSELGNLNNVSLLHIYLNPFLSGTIPASLGFLTQLTTLDLSTNLLTGTIPYDFVNLLNRPSFRYLNLAWNNLSGNLSNTFFRSKPLYATINLSQNTWTCGSLPSWCDALGGACYTDKCLLATTATTSAPNVITQQKRAVQETESVTLNWLASTNGEDDSVSYEAEMADSDSDNYSLVYRGKDPSATIQGLFKGKVYQFRIRALQGDLLGPWSDVIKAMVK